MTLISFKRLALTGGLMLALGGAALAAPTADKPMPGHDMRHMDPAKTAEHHAQRLRDTLQLRADQEPALQAYLNASRPAERPHDRPAPESFKAMTTPERLDRMAARMNEMQTRFQQHAAAVKTFYAALSPAQKKAFDAMPQGMGMHGRMGMKHQGGMMMRHGPDGGPPPPPGA